jgi:hypothetical protein
MTQAATIFLVLAVHAQIDSLGPSAVPYFQPPAVPNYYTVQILAAPVENRQVLLAVYESQRAGGHLVYYYPKRVDGRQYLRLRTGIFQTPAQARAYAEQLRAKEGLDGFVAKAEIAVAHFRDEFRIVTTPSGIWLVSATSAKEVYAPTHGQIDLEHTAPRISPDGRDIAFYEDRRLVRITLGTGAVRVLRESASGDDLLHCIVRWSPDGRYLAYLDTVAWEFPTRLWIARADGTENRCLITDETQQTKVKSFEWHPYRNRIFYVTGPTHGTVSLGGSLCGIDLDGTRRTLVEAELSQGTEVLSEFRIANGLLEYRTVRHHADGREPQYSLHRRPLRDLE